MLYYLFQMRKWCILDSLVQSSESNKWVLQYFFFVRWFKSRNKLIINICKYFFYVRLLVLHLFSFIFIYSYPKLMGCPCTVEEYHESGNACLTGSAFGQKWINPAIAVIQPWDWKPSALSGACGLNPVCCCQGELAQSKMLALGHQSSNKVFACPYITSNSDLMWNHQELRSLHTEHRCWQSNIKPGHRSSKL